MSSPLPYRSVDPATGEVRQTFEPTTDAEVETALAGAFAAYRTGLDSTRVQRVELVRSISRLLAERRQELGALITREMGKPLAEAEEEIDFCTAIFQYFADEADTLLADQPITTPDGDHAVIQKQSLGPVLGVMPWNFPLYQVARFAAPNLVLGNTVLLKPAESVPSTALAFQQLVEDAGAPAGAFTTLFATHAQIETIIADRRVQGVSLTGSERAGAVVGALAGRHLKKCVLELGGSDPYVILDSADVTASAELAWQTRLYNTGQACNSNKRLIVQADIYEEFVAELTKLAGQMRPGDPAAGGEGSYAPMTSRTAAENLAAQVDEAVRQGATLHAGGILGEAPGAYYSPAVLTGVTPEMAAYREELFGPVAVVYRAEDDEDALRLANDTAFGLGGAVFSTDVERATRLASRLECGMANVNTPAGEGAGIPFGGVKRSGFGRELGPLGIDEFANKRLLYTAGTA